MYRVFLTACVLATTLVALPSVGVAQSANHCGPGELPRYVLGFAELRERVGLVMGEAITCEFADPNGSGDVHQRTTTGLAFWRKSANTPTFTDGYNHWALVGGRLVAWTGGRIDPPGTAATAPGTFAMPPLDGRAPVACQQQVVSEVGVLTCRYALGDTAMWRREGAVWQLLGTAPTGGETTLTEAGTLAFGAARADDPRFEGVRPEFCSDGVHDDGEPYRVCGYPGGILAAWVQRDGGWALESYLRPPSDAWVFVNPPPRRQPAPIQAPVP